MSSRIETIIFSNLIHNEQYLRRVLPFLKTEYFVHSTDAFLYKAVSGFVEKYNKPPTTSVLAIEANKDKTLTDDQHTELLETINELEPTENDLEWLTDETEKFCKEKALYNAIKKSIHIIDGKEKKLSTDGIPTLLEEALGVCFDSDVGHDYIENSDDRYEYYHNVEERIPCDLDMLNQITKGGVAKKTLNLLMAGVGVGKTLTLCSLGSSYLAQGYNVLYITMEMSAEKIAERIDQNLLNITSDDLMVISKTMFAERMDRLKKKTKGKLIIKEYPTSSAHAGHFNSLISELKMKKQFVPHVIIIDYLNICASSRLKENASENTYTYVKAIAEECRGLAVRHRVPIWTATQTTRGGSVNSDPNMTDTAESFGVPATLDLQLAIVETEELIELNQLMFKQLKNRYRDKNIDARFVIGVDKNKMRLYTVEKSAQMLTGSRTVSSSNVTRRAKPDLSGIKVE